ncbi:hypothetical protein ACS73_29885, partial [Pseudomonas lini]
GKSITAFETPLMVDKPPAVPPRAASRGMLNATKAPSSSTCQLLRLKVFSYLKPVGSRSSIISGPTNPRPSSSLLFTCG